VSAQVEGVGAVVEAEPIPSAGGMPVDDQDPTTGAGRRRSSRHPGQPGAHHDDIERRHGHRSLPANSTPHRHRV
jgi:hypothetical protein